MKIVTVIGTRPEIIRLACTIKKLDKYTNHVLVHTGQNYSYELNRAIFRDLDLRDPDYLLNVKARYLSEQLANIFAQTGAVFIKERPDAVLVLGDTNSALSVIIAKRMKIPIFHMEAGDRSFDENVPEESNRKIIDHIADMNLAYTEHSRRNLLREGIHPSRIYVTGSPLREVYETIKDKVERSSILKRLKLDKGKYIVASLHREENVDNKGSLASLHTVLGCLTEKYDMPIIVSAHPRTQWNRERFNLKSSSGPRVFWHRPFGLADYLKLEINARFVISDSGTIHEDASILKFPAIAIRTATEKPEAIDAGHCVISGIKPACVLKSVDLIIQEPVDPIKSPMPPEYARLNVSGTVVRIILGQTDILNGQVGGGRAKIRKEWT